MLRRNHSVDHGQSSINLTIHDFSRHKKKNKSGNITQSTHDVYEGIAGSLLRKKILNLMASKHAQRGPAEVHASLPVVNNKEPHIS